MKKLKKFKDRVLMHPLMAFLLLVAFVVVLSGILDLFDASVIYNKLNPKTGNYESTLITVESLFSLSGIKYIFSNTVSNFVSFTPLSMLLITLIGIGIMDKSGLLDTLFFLLTKNVSKTVVTFVFVLLCVFSSITGDLSFIVFIPLAALLFKYGKRNPKVGIVMSFASLSLGYGINVFLNSVDSSLLEYTEMSARIISEGYAIGGYAYLYIMLFAILIGAGIITYITEKIVAPKMGKYVSDEEEEIVDKEGLTRREVRGLVLAGIGVSIYLLIFIYNIIPNVPLGGNLLDYSQSRYIDKLFGYDSFFNSGFVFVVTMLFFIAGLLYGLGAKTIDNHRDIFNYLSHSLDGIGKVLILILFASMFISLLKYTNIGLLITAFLANVINSSSFTGIPLLLLVFFVSIITTIFLPTYLSRWTILSGTVVPAMMTSGFTPEFAQLVFSAGSSIVYGLTPAMAYFVIYISYLENYDKDGTGLIKSINYIIPYALAIFVMWILLLIVWYLVGIPLGIGTSAVL